ncbi:C4-dicarboxylate transport sensor protein DctS [Candidatus Propionivibrio aalborgensis]|uniref:histidine kinase n=1 Tax=Candidatus Propionivibrio aalborgensis TaxID=1860101 RepID=A0A1A8XZY7_9RHOO|nr:PAS domain-containing sensor histidine kinase [Candidatus Propionivibrio aalborgensis]SBT10281.1 C4-dicarboxylate transport sensor protein DctS [Candidatus Propionivibrio aalborgensis]
MADALARNRYRPRKPAQMKWSNWYLTTLKLAVGLLLALLIVLFWLLRQNAANEQRTTLIADVLWLEQSVNFRLEGNAEQFQQLALDLVLAPETNQSALFRLRSQHLLKNNPELQQVLWLDASAQILAALPTQNLPRLGLGEPGNEVQAQTIERASKLGKPVYTEVYRISNSPQFEVFFPVFQNNQYQGSLVGVYSLNTLLKHLVPWWFTEKYQVRILDADGTTLASKSKVSDAATTLSYTLPFDPPGYGLAFQVTAYRSDSSIAQTLITTLIIALAAAVLVSLWVMRGHIHRRLAAEQALRSEYAFRKAMEDSLTVGMRARDLEGVVTYTNPAFCQMVGFSAEELIDAKPPMPYWAPEDMERIQSIHNSIIDGKAPHEGFEVRLMRKDGSRFDALIYEAPLIDADGRQTGWMASIIDVTVRKHAEELARQQQEKLQFTSRLITMGEMASTLAHELNQPLAAITSYNTGCLNKLESGNFSPDELKHALGKIAVQAQRAGQIIRRVHDFVRKSEPKLAPCDLAEVIDDSVGFIDAAAKLLNIRIEREIQGMRPELMADPVMIEQVLLNLMRNGIEAMSETPLENRRLTVKLYQKDDHMQIRVIDRGSGIPLELREKLFTPFYSTKTEGMGIGLNICRSIIEFHRGRLWVEDNPEGGTIFVISLPITMP